MKKTLACLLLLAVTGLTTSTTLSGNAYVCVSTHATKYHMTKNCRGLHACNHEIRQINRKDAEKRGMSLCKWEY